MKAEKSCCKHLDGSRNVPCGLEQPTAEGAEQLIRVRNILQDFYRRGDYELEQAAEDIMRVFTQQPTAGGAEAFLLEQRNGDDKPITYAVGKDGWVYKMIIHTMNKFATLHAQRLADKMVSERLKGELSLFLR